jgi:hypothetical protein
MSYIIEKRKGIYEVFSKDRIHLGSTTRYSEIRHMIDTHNHRERKKRDLKILEWYREICNRYSILSI